MSKPLAVKVALSKSVTIRTTDASVSVVVDQLAAGGAKASVSGKLEQGGGDFVVDPGHNVTIGGTTSPAVAVAGQNVSVTSSGAGHSLALSGVTGAAATLAAGDVTIHAAGAGNSVDILGTGGAAITASTDGGAFTQQGGNFTVVTGHAVSIGGSTSPTVTVSGEDVTVSAVGAGNSLALAGLSGASTILGDAATTVRVFGEDVTVSSAGAGNTLTLVAVDGAGAVFSTDAAQLSIQAPGELIQLGTDGNILIQDAGGNVDLVGAQVVVNGGNIFLNGTTMSQTILGLANVVTLPAAATNYPTLSPTDVPNLNSAARLNVEPNAAGTTIQSLFLHAPNPDGRELRIQNVGTAPGQTLTLVNQSGSGTTGDLFFGPGDFPIPQGGGVLVGFDANVTASGAWLVRAVPPGGSGGGSLFTDVITGGPFTFPNNDVALPLGQITLVNYTTDASTRAFRGLVNSNPGGNVEGLIVCFLNQNPNPANVLAFQNEDTGSTDSNRFKVVGGSSASGNSGGGVWFRYAGSGSAGRWQQFINTSTT